MTESEKKDMILKYLDNESNKTGSYQLIEFERIFPKGTMTYKEMKYLIEQIAQDGYIKFDGSHFKHKFEISKFIISGGYQKLENQNDLEGRKEKDLKDITNKKTLYETKLAKWQITIFWPAFIFTLIGSILGIISFVMQLKK